VVNENIIGMCHLKGECDCKRFGDITLVPLGVYCRQVVNGMGKVCHYYVKWQQKLYDGDVGQCLNREVRDYDRKDCARTRRNALHIHKWLFMCHTLYKKYSQNKYTLNSYKNPTRCNSVSKFYFIFIWRGNEPSFVPTKENQMWRIKTNEELDKLIKHKNVINYNKAQRLSWFGHLQRMLDTRTIKKIFNWKPLTKRSQGRPKYRWEDNIKQDIC
jgi:hypothetical protein